MSSWNLCDYVTDETTGNQYYISTVKLLVPEDGAEGIGLYTHETMILSDGSSVRFEKHTSQNAAEHYHKDIVSKIELGLQFNSEVD